eukprot:scaffold14418_cov22-Tisochrysis_lutea.AAC.1
MHVGDEDTGEEQGQAEIEMCFQKGCMLSNRIFDGGTKAMVDRNKHPSKSSGDCTIKQLAANAARACNLSHQDQADLNDTHPMMHMFEVLQLKLPPLILYQLDTSWIRTLDSA